jgi:tight adherence protein B
MVSGTLASALLALLVFIAVISSLVSVAMLWESARDRRRRRNVGEQLEKLQIADVQSGPSGIVRAEAARVPHWVRTVVRRFPRLTNVQIRIEQAALSWTVQSFLIRTFAFALGLGLATQIFFGSWFYAAVGAAVGAFLPYLYVGRKRTRRLGAFEAGFPEAIELLVRAIRAGHPVSSGFKMVADESPDPISTEFRQVFEEQRFGLPFDESLLGLADRVPLVDVRIFTTAVLIQREVGGNLAEVLEKLSYVVRERFRIKGQIQVMTAQGRMGAMVVGALPFGTGLLFFVINPEMMLDFFRSSAAPLAIGFALFMQALGMLWIRKIITIEV